MQCTNCKQEILATAKFCPDCGAKIEHTGKTCPNKECNRTGLPPEALFCPDCGAKLKVELKLSDRIFTEFLEIILLLQCVDDFVTNISSFSTPHNERRRYLEAIMKVPNLIIERTGIIKNNQLTDIMKFNCNLINRYCSEANYVLPEPGEHRFERDETRLKDLKGDLSISINKLIASFTKLSELNNNEFHKRKNGMYRGDDYLWKILGFGTYDHFSEYISPKTNTLLRRNDFKQKLIFKDILSTRNFKENDFYNKGYQPLMFVDTINALIKDDYISIDGDVFTLNYVGIEFLKNNI